MICISLEKLLNLHKVVLLCKLHSLVPLVQKYATVNGLLHITCFYVALDSELNYT